MKYPLDDYKNDKMYPKIVTAVERILAQKDFVSPIDLFQELDLLQQRHVDDWLHGRISFLEKVINCNLLKASRILQIFRYHVHDLNMVPSINAYTKKGKGSKEVLRFSKTGDPKIEEAYSRHFLKNDRKGQTPIDEMKRLRNSIFSLRSKPDSKSQIKKVIKGFLVATGIGVINGSERGAHLAFRLKEFFEQHEIHCYDLNNEFFELILCVQRELMKMFFPEASADEILSNEEYQLISKSLDEALNKLTRES